MLQVQVVQYMITVSQFYSHSSLLTPHSTNKNVLTLKRKNHEERNLEIHHSDSSSHLDRHRHQPGSHQLHLLGRLPLAPPKRRGTRKRMSNIAHPLCVTTSACKKSVLISNATRPFVH